MCSAAVQVTDLRLLTHLGNNFGSPVFWQLEFWHRALSAYGIPAMEFWQIEFWQWNFGIQYFGNAYNLAFKNLSVF